MNSCEVAQDVLDELYSLAASATDAGADGDGGTWCEALGAPTIALTCRQIVSQGKYTDGCPVAGRRPQHFRPGWLGVGSAVGRYLASCAELEAASVPAFERLACELSAHGAPSLLIERARRAAAEEVRHAGLVGELASGHGVAAPQAVAGPMSVRSLLEVALENAIEGVVREGFGAVQALCTLRRARAPEVRAVYMQIAVEESAHADLALDVARFCLSRLDERERALVRAALDGAVRDLERELDTEVDPALVAELGLPSKAEAKTLVAGLRDGLWATAA